MGGKTGGKEPTRQGQGTNPEKTDEAVETVTRWLSEKLSL